MGSKMNWDIESEKNMAMKVLKIIGMVILGVGVCILLGFVVMWLWNWLMPAIFGLSVITYWQAVGIFILGKLIFGGIGGSGNSGSSSKSSKNENKSGIGYEIKKEIKKEFDKEFEKDYEKRHNSDSEEVVEENADYDEMYEKWWDTKGEKDFKKYMDDDQETN